MCWMKSYKSTRPMMVAYEASRFLIAERPDFKLLDVLLCSKVLTRLYSWTICTSKSLQAAFSKFNNDLFRNIRFLQLSFASREHASISVVATLHILTFDNMQLEDVTDVDVVVKGPFMLSPSSDSFKSLLRLESKFIHSTDWLCRGCAIIRSPYHGFLSKSSNWQQHAFPLVMTTRILSRCIGIKYPASSSILSPQNKNKKTNYAEQRNVCTVGLPAVHVPRCPC